MQAKTAIDKIDNMYRNEIPFETKIDWLRSLDHKIYLEIINTHEGAPEEYPGIDADGDNELVADAPYDDLYIAFLRQKLDEVNNDTARYINSSQIFNDKLAAFEAAYHRSHMPKERAYVRFY